jgi:cytochrome P450
MLPNGPRSKFLFLSFKKNPPVFLLKNKKKYGNTFSFLYNKRPIICFFSPKAVSEITLTKQENFIKIGPTIKLRELLGDGLITSEEPIHMEHKRVISPAFHSRNILSYAKGMLDITRTYTKNWETKNKIKTNLEIMSLTFDITTKMLFDSDLSKEVKTVKKNMDMVTLGTTQLLPFKLNKLRKYNLPYFNRYKKSTIVLRDIAKNVFDSKTKNKKNKLSVLIKTLSDAINDKKIKKQDAYDETLTMITAGHETTSNAITWALAYLSDRLDLWELLKQESIEIFKYENNEDFGKMVMNSKIATAVINESLRLYPPVWSNTRRSIKDVEIDGVFVKKGTNILISSYVSHRNEEYFYNSENFIPERWYDGLEKNLPTGAYFPFSLGSRRCIGDQFAILEAKIILLEIANKMKLSLCNEFPKTSAELALRTKGNVLMNVEME